MPTVTCATCKAQFDVDHEYLRGLIDADRQPACVEGCRPAIPPVADTPTAGTKKLIATDYLLLALAVFEQAGVVMTARGRLVMAAWRMCPEVYGLKGFEAVAPDAKRVDNEIFRIVHKGLALRPFQNTYRLTTAGGERAHRVGIVAKAAADAAVALVRAELEARRL